jgi:adenine specific DNA methylase Mod
MGKGGKPSIFIEDKSGNWVCCDFNCMNNNPNKKTNFDQLAKLEAKDKGKKTPGSFVTVNGILESSSILVKLYPCEIIEIK